jgi:hypothetical protein
MDYLIALYNKEQEDMIYKVYVTETLKILSGTTTSYIDLLEHRKKPQDSRSGAEITADVIERCGLVVKS